MSNAKKPLPVRFFNDRVRIVVDDSTIYVRIDDEGDMWIETPDTDTSLLIPKRAIGAVQTAIARARNF